MRGSSEFLRALVGALAIMVGSAGVGMVVNQVSPHGIPVFPGPEGKRLYVPPGVLSLTVEEAYAEFGGEGALFVDARSPEGYGEGHIPGSVNLPPEGFEEGLLDHVDQIEGAGKIIVICEGVECGDSILVAERLLEVAEGPIYVVEDGWRGWEGAGHPVKEGREP